MIVSVLLRSQLENGDHTPDTPTSAGSSKHSRNISLTNLEELDLESDLPSRPRSRPIGGAKARTTSNMTHISSGEGLRRTERGHKPHEMTLLVTGVVLEPGLTRISVEGEVGVACKSHDLPPRPPPPQAKVSACFQAQKVTLKCGALDFVLTLPADISEESTVTVETPHVNMEVAMAPDLGGEECVYIAMARCSPPLLLLLLQYSSLAVR